VQNQADLALEGAKHARTTLMAGFTTVRDLGGTGANIALRNAVNRGYVPGPRIFTSGKALPPPAATATPPTATAAT
jgi:imidazolonepropionase-like amidohydrolase